MTLSTRHNGRSTVRSLRELPSRSLVKASAARASLGASALLPLALALALPACASSNGGDGSKGKGGGAAGSEDADFQLVTLKDDELYTGIPKEKLTLDDDLKFPPDRDSDAILVAQWVKERRDAITWCLAEKVTEFNEFNKEEVRYKRVFPGTKRTEDRLDQAVAIGLKVVEKVPDSTQERYRLAHCLYIKGAYAYWQLDGVMREIERAQDKQETAKADELMKKTAPYRRAIPAYHQRALTHFIRYSEAVPLSMDNRPLHFIWCIYFQLGNWRQALDHLNMLIESNPPAEQRRDAEYYRQIIQEYLTMVDIQGAGKTPTPDAQIRGKRLPE